MSKLRPITCSQGEFDSIKSASKHFGVATSTIQGRLSKGWSMDEALGIVERAKRTTGKKLVSSAGTFSSLRDAASKLGIKAENISNRLSLGWTVDEALEITLHPPECDFWNFQLGNYWLESLDYRYHDVHINPFTAKYAEDGSVRIILSKHKPLDIDLQSYINWMDSCNRNEGTMCVRWIRASSHPNPSVRLIKLSSLEPLSV